MLLFLQEGVGQLVAKGAVGDEKAAFAMFRQRTEVDPDTCSAGHLAEDGKEPFELRALGHLHPIDESRDEFISVFESVTDIVETLDKFTGTLIDVVGCPIELARDGIVFGGVAE